MIDTHHEALIKSTVTEAEHVSELMGSKLYNSHEGSTLELLLGRIFFLSPFWHESMDAMNSTISISITEAEVT